MSKAKNREWQATHTKRKLRLETEDYHLKNLFTCFILPPIARFRYLCGTRVTFPTYGLLDESAVVVTNHKEMTRLFEKLCKG